MSSIRLVFEETNELASYFPVDLDINNNFFDILVADMFTAILIKRGGNKFLLHLRGV